MFRITLVLWFSVNVLFAQAQNSIPRESPHDRMNGLAISCVLVDGSGMPFAGTSSPSLDAVPFQEHYLQPQATAAWKRSGDS